MVDPREWSTPSGRYRTRLRDKRTGNQTMALPWLTATMYKSVAQFQSPWRSLSVPASKGACPRVSSTQDNFSSSHRIPRTGREPTLKERRLCQRNHLPVMEQVVHPDVVGSVLVFLFVMLQGDGDMSWIPPASFAPLLAGLLRAINDRWDLCHTFLHHVVGGRPHGRHRLCCKRRMPSRLQTPSLCE